MNNTLTYTLMCLKAKELGFLQTKNNTYESVISSMGTAKQGVEQKTLYSIKYGAKKSIQQLADRLNIVYVKVSESIQKRFLQVDFTVIKNNFTSYGTFVIKGCKNGIAIIKQILTNAFQTLQIAFLRVNEKRKKQIVVSGIAALSLILIIIISSLIIKTKSSNNKKTKTNR